MSPRRSRTLTKTYVPLIALALAACTVGEGARPDGPAQPQPVPPVVAAPQPEAEVPRPEEAPVTGPVRVAVILPRSGPPYLQQYADLLLEGIHIAARRGPGNVELVVLDDQGLAERATELVAAAADSGAVAVIGPLLSAGVEFAAPGRDDALVVLSPTAADVPPLAEGVYTLNAVDLRGPRALAEYARAGGLSNAAVLYPSDAALSRQAWAFARAFQELGGRVATMVPYDSGTTTFGTHIGRVIDSRADVVYLPLSPQDVEVVAPQLAYYGLRDSADVVVMGNESWTDEYVLRLVETQFTDSVIAATASPRGMGETGWDDFVLEYEETHRRALDNPFPALGHDAMMLVLNALDRGANTSARVAERFAATRAFLGATGVISVEDGMITRAPFIHQIVGGRLQLAPPADQLRTPPTYYPAAPPAESAP